MFKPVLKLYWADQPVLPYLYDNLYSLLKNVHSTIVKPVVFAERATAYQIMKIDLKKGSNVIDVAKINTRLVAATLMKKLKNKDNITQAELKQFYKEVKSFVLAAILKLPEKILFSSRIVGNACIYNLWLMRLANVDILIKRVKNLVGYLMDADWVETMILQFSLFLESNETNFASFKQKNMQLDEFFL